MKRNLDEARDEATAAALGQYYLPIPHTHTSKIKKLISTKHR